MEKILPDDAEKQDTFERRVVLFFEKALRDTEAKMIFVAHGCIRLALEKHMTINSNDTEYTEYARIIRYKPTPLGWDVSYVNEGP